MNEVRNKLMSISAALSSLAKQVENLTDAIEKESAKKAPAKKSKAPARKAKASIKKAKAAPKKRAPKKASPAKPKAKATAKSGAQSMLDTIFGMISRSRNGITVAQLKKKTRFEDRQVSNALYKLSKKGKIETISRGVYIKKK